VAPRRTQQERRQQAERRLVDAAAELISEAGPSTVTLSRVGERAGYSRGLVAHHFGSKAALMERVAETVSREFGDRLATGLRPGSSLLEELRHLVSVYFATMADAPPLNRARLVLVADAIAHADSDSREIVTEASRDFREALSARLDAAAGRGELPEHVDPASFAAVLVGTLRGVTFESMLDPAVDLSAARAEVDALLVARFS
jgi:AcrR family transcriptional regulator